MQKMEEIVEQLRILKQVQQAFIDGQEWEEVSRIQFDIDELQLAKERSKPWRMELWFRVALYENIVFPWLNGLVSKDIYVLKHLLSVKGDE